MMGVRSFRPAIFFKRSWLIVLDIATMSRVICLGSLSSFSHSPRMWQWAQETPRDLLYPTCMINSNRPAGTLFSTLRFLNTASAGWSSFPAICLDRAATLSSLDCLMASGVVGSFAATEDFSWLAYAIHTASTKTTKALKKVLRTIQFAPNLLPGSLRD